MTSSLLPRSPVARVATVLCAGSLLLAGVLGGGALASTARLTDSQSSSAALVGTGTLALSASGGASAGTWTGSVSLVPGSAEYAGLTVANTGTVALRYAVNALSASPLAASLQLTVVRLTSATSPCSATTFDTGTRVSTLDGPFGATPATDVIGSVASGEQPGDRRLAVGDSERLCLRVTFPTGTGLGAAARGTSATTSFTVSAESA